MQESKPLKVMIVTSESMWGNSQTSITLRNIWRDETLFNVKEFVIYKKPYINTHDTLHTVHFLSNWKYPLAWLAKRKVSQKVSVKMKENKRAEGVSVSANNKKSKLQLIRQLLYTIVDRSFLFLTKNDYSVIDRFSPDVIFTMGGSIAIMKVTEKIAKHTRKPIALHFMDNWAESLQWDYNPLLSGYKKRMDRLLDRMYERTICAFTISDEMAEAYEKRTGIKHITLSNSVNVAEWRCNEIPSDREIRFIYAGGLHLGRDKVIYEIAKCMDTLSTEAGKPCFLDVYTNAQDSEYIFKIKECGDNVNLYTAVPHDKVLSVYNKASVLLLVESLDTNDELSVAFSKYSVSTKTAEYLASGRLILFVGSESKALTHYLLKNEAAIVVTKYDELYKALQRSILLEGENKNIIQNALNLAEQRHNVNNVNTFLYRTIMDSIGEQSI